MGVGERSSNHMLTLYFKEDKEDDLVKERPPYGRFMLGFDFHLTDKGPKLIEVTFFSRIIEISI